MKGNQVFAFRVGSQLMCLQVINQETGLIPKTLKVAVSEKWEKEGGCVCCVCVHVHVRRCGGRDTLVFKFSVLSFAIELLLLVHVSVNNGSHPA